MTSSTPLTDTHLAEIRDRYDRWKAASYDTSIPMANRILYIGASANDVPTLLAEVECREDLRRELAAEVDRLNEICGEAERLADEVEDLLFTVGDPDSQRAAVRDAWQRYVECCRHASRRRYSMTPTPLTSGQLAEIRDEYEAHARGHEADHLLAACWPCCTGCEVAHHLPVLLAEVARLTARLAEPSRPCPIEHYCADADESATCACWCHLHDCPLEECPTYRAVVAGYEVVWVARDAACELADRLKAELARERRDHADLADAKADLETLLRKHQADLGGYQRARSGLGNRGVPMWKHSCGNVEGFPEEQLAAIGGGCDACESGSDNPQDWQPLYVRTHGEPKPTGGGPNE